MEQDPAQWILNEIMFAWLSVTSAFAASERLWWKKSSICDRICDKMNTVGKVDILLRPRMLHSFLWWGDIFPHLPLSLWAALLELCGVKCFAHFRKRRVFLMDFACWDFPNRSRDLKKKNRSNRFMSLVFIEFHNCNTLTDKMSHYVGHYSLMQHSCICSMNRKMRRKNTGSFQVDF